MASENKGRSCRIPVIGKYVDSWRYAFRYDPDGLAKPRRCVLFGNYALNVAGQLTAGIFYTQLFLILFSAVSEEIRVATQNTYTSIIAALSSAAGLLQLVSPFFFERLKKRKGLIYVFHSIYHVCEIFLLPLCVFLPFDVITRANVFVVVLTLRTIASSLCGPGMSAWHIYSMAEFCRSDYYMVSNALSSIINPIISLLLGIYLDAFVANEKALLGILIMRGLALLLVLVELKLFWHVPEPEYNTGIENTNRITFKDILLAPVRCKAFVGIVLIYVLYVFGSGMAPYYGVYLRDGAELSYTYQSLVGIAGVPCSILTLPFWNKMVHKYGWLKPMSVSLALYAVCHAINALVTVDTKWMFFVSNIFCQFVCGGMQFGMSNLPFLRVPKDLQTGCLAFYNAMGSITGIGVAFVAQAFQKATDGKILHLFGLSIENRAYMCFFPFALILIDAGIIGWLAFVEKRRNGGRDVGVPSAEDTASVSDNA